MVRHIDAHANDGDDLTRTEAIEIVSGHYGWSTYKPSIAAYEIVITYGLDRIEDPKLRLALTSWPSALDEIAPEQEALHAVSLPDDRKEISRVADDFERPRYDNENNWYGVPAGDMALALIRDHGAVRVQRRVLDLMRQYRAQLREVRETLDQNLETLENRN